MEIEEILQFFFVFDILQLQKRYSNIFEAIQDEIVINFSFHAQNFNFLDKRSKEFLVKLSKSDRKFYLKDSEIIEKLVKQGILEIEASLEQKRVNLKSQKLKKSLRKYQVRDKIHFKSNFVRFYFRFIEPNILELEDKNFDKIMSKIRLDFDNFCSLAYERLAIKLVAKKFDVTQVSSFWTKDEEIDIFSSEDKVIVGEVKYKDRKVNKSVYNLLLLKCQKLAIEPDFIVIVSKVGFSKEFEKLKDRRLVTFSSDDFYELIPKYLRQTKG